MIHKSRIAAVPVAVSSLVKWDAVFILPAYFRRLLAKPSSFLRAAVISCIAGMPFALWFLYKMFLSPGENTYVEEIARRGPNVYRFLIDAFLVLSGYIQWAAIDVYNHGLSAYSAVVAVFLLITAPAAAFFFYRGTLFVFKNRDPYIEAIMIYTCGYFLIHMVYQNSKSRYVLPVLWILNYVLVAGIKHTAELFNSRKGKQFLIFILKYRFIAAVSAGFAIFLVLLTGSLLEPVLLAFCVVLALLLILLIHRNGTPVFPVLVSSVVVIVISANIYFGREMLNHYSLRRVEFKRVSLYFNQKPTLKGKVLISERSVIDYYSHLDRRLFVKYAGFSAENGDELYNQLVKKNVRYVYVDDFYRRRLKRGDKNAVEKNAHLMEIIQNEAGRPGRYKMINKIEVTDDIVGYLYEVVHNADE